MILTDPFELIKSFPPGSALYVRAGESATSLETCILIREDEDQIQKIPANPIVELRSGIWENRICPVVVMIKVAGLPYETWWNYHRDDDGNKYFDDMILQAMIPILVYDDRQQRRSIGIRNSLAPSFKKYIEAIVQKSPWSMKDFDAAKEKLCAQYLTVAALWEVLGADIFKT